MRRPNDEPAETCGEVGTSFPIPALLGGEPVYTEPCKLEAGHDTVHDWDIVDAVRYRLSRALGVDADSMSIDDLVIETCRRLARGETRAGLDQATAPRCATPGRPEDGPYPAGVDEYADEVVAWIDDLDRRNASTALRTAVLRRLSGADLAGVTVRHEWGVHSTDGTVYNVQGGTHDAAVREAALLYYGVPGDPERTPEPGCAPADRYVMTTPAGEVASGWIWPASWTPPAGEQYP